MAATSVFIVKESGGTYGRNGPPKFEEWSCLKKDLEEARFTSVSSNGNVVAIGNSSSVSIFDARDGSQKCRIQEKMLSATFSPMGGYLVEWSNPGSKADNFQVWSIGNGKDVKVVQALKLSKKPDIQFSQDETIYARLSDNAVIFSKAPDFARTEKKTPEGFKVAKFSLSTASKTPTDGPLFVLCYIAGAGGQPSSARLFRYPIFEMPVASKTLMQTDRVEMKWNKMGTAVLLVCSTDVDKTGESYYGKTIMHYLDTKGMSSLVMTEKDSAIIHAAEWSPNSTEFAIISGKMPHTRATLMNSKCEVVLDFGVSARNSIYFNPQGNILLLGGFGNLAHGRVEVWEVQKHKKQIAVCSAPNSTQLEWLNDGCHFITAITAPRMQVGNEFHVWNYKGNEVWKWTAEKHLFGVVPLKSEPPPQFPEADLEKLVKAIGNKPLAAKVEEQKKSAVYVPPSKRGTLVGSGATINNKGANANPSNSPGSNHGQLTETEKKVRTIKKKLEQIEKIKLMINDGQKVEKNQEDKLKTETELLDQLSALGVS